MKAPLRWRRLLFWGVIGRILVLAFDQRVAQVKPFEARDASRRPEADEGHQPVEASAVRTSELMALTAWAGKSGREHRRLLCFRVDPACTGAPSSEGFAVAQEAARTRCALARGACPAAEKRALRPESPSEAGGGSPWHRYGGLGATGRAGRDRRSCPCTASEHYSFDACNR